MIGNMDLLGDELEVGEPSFTERHFELLHAVLFYTARAAAAYMLATGLWYFVVASNGLARYSLIAETGKNLVFMSVFVILFLTGDPDA